MEATTSSSNVISGSLLEWTLFCKAMHEAINKVFNKNGNKSCFIGHIRFNFRQHSFLASGVPSSQTRERLRELEEENSRLALRKAEMENARLKAMAGNQPTSTIFSPI